VGLAFWIRNTGLALDMDLAFFKSMRLVFWDRNTVLTLLERNTGMNLTF